MPSTLVAAKSVPLTADATTAGLVTIADNSTWITGTKVTISSTTEAPTECIVVEMIGSTQLRLRALGARSKYGFSDMWIYDTVDSARISREQQVVPVLAVFEERQKA